MSRILVLAPHPDDEVIGCGGSIATHVAAGSEVTIGFLTSGESGGRRAAADLAQIREQEAVSAAATLGVAAERLRFLHIPDGGIVPSDAGQFAIVLRLLREVRPEVLYLPHPEDGSFDHEAAFTLCWRAAGMSGSGNYPDCGPAHWIPTVLGFEVWTPIPCPAFSRDITEMAERKVTALACYRSQAPGVKGPAQSSLISPAGLQLSGWRGAQSTGGYREAFAVLRLGEAVL